MFDAILDIVSLNLESREVLGTHFVISHVKMQIFHSTSVHTTKCSNDMLQGHVPLWHKASFRGNMSLLYFLACVCKGYIIIPPFVEIVKIK